MILFGDHFAKIKFFNVGHGDAILVEIYKDEEEVWRCLIDGGQGNKLKNYLEDLKITKIDLLVLSHLDFDHIDGLIKCFEKTNIEVVKAWLPFIPAIQRFAWMFGERTRKCVGRGNQLVQILKDRQATIIYPLEGYTEAFHNEAIELQVVSPAKKLIEILYFGDDQIESLLKIPLPINEIIGKGTFNNLANLEIEFPDIDPFKSNSVTDSLDREIPLERIEIKDEQKNDICKLMDYEPDWFGDHLLNDTSIIFTLQLFISGIKYKFLFSGDQENWSYILLNSKNLYGFDIFKLPHHGGRLYFNEEVYPNEILRHLAPKYTVISASETGKHKLPRETTIDACINYSENIFVTMPSFPSFLSKYSFDDGFYINTDTPNTLPKVNFDLKFSEGIEFFIGNGKIESNRAPIRTGKLVPQPIVQFHTIIERDLLSGTIARKKTNLAVIEKVLNKIKSIRSKPNGHSLKNYLDFQEQHPLGLKEIRTLLSEEGIDLFDSDIIDAINEGIKLNKIIYCKKDNRYSPQMSGQWYLAPEKKDVDEFIKAISEFSYVFLVSNRSFNIDQYSLLNEIEWDVITSLFNACSGFPKYIINEHIIPRAIPYIIKEYFIYTSVTKILDLSTSTYNDSKEKYLLLLLKKIDLEDQGFAKSACDLLFKNYIKNGHESSHILSVKEQAKLIHAVPKINSLINKELFKLNNTTQLSNLISDILFKFPSPQMHIPSNPDKFARYYSYRLKVVTTENELFKSYLSQTSNESLFEYCIFLFNTYFNQEFKKLY